MGSIDIPPFMREKMKQNKKSSDSDIPPFLKKKEDGESITTELEVGVTGQLTQSVPTTLQSGLAGNTNEFNPLKDIVSIQTSDNLGNPIITQSNGSVLSINPKTIPITPLANPKTYVSDLQKRIKSGSLTKQDEKVIAENQKGNHNFDAIDESELTSLISKYDPINKDLVNAPIPSILSQFLPETEGKTFAEVFNTTDGKLASIKMLKEKVYENFNKQYEGAESVPDLDENSKKEIERLTQLEKKLSYEKNKSETFPTFLDAVVRTDESGNLWTKFKNRVLLLSPITAVQGMLGISAETEDKIQKLPDGFSIGLNGLKYTEPVEHERVVNSLLKGEPISESQVGQITMQGLEAKEAMAKDAYVDKTIDKEQYTNQINEIQKDRYNAILDNKEITRSFLSNGIANLADDINSEIPSVTGSVGVAKKVFGHTWNYTDAQIEQYGKAVAQANGLDPNDARVKDAIKYLQDNEGAMFMENSIAKSGFARDFAKGLASPIRGISATIEDIGKSTAEVYAESQSQGNVNVSEQKIKRVENSWEGAVSDILEGTGQFVTQAGLSLGISGAIGAVGRGVLGRAGIAALEGDIALADMAATDLVGKALLSSKDALATFITAGAQSYDGNLKQALSYTSDDTIARNVARGMAGLEGATELFLSPITVARGIAKNLFNKATTTKGLVNILSDAAIVDKSSAIKNFIKSTVKVVGTEMGEEEVIALADYTSNSILNPNSKTFQNRDLMNEMANTAYQTGLSMVLPALASGAGAANVNNFSKGSLLIAAQNRQQMLDDMNKRLFDGDMSQDEYNEKAAIINTASVANETLPLKENGVKLNSEEKADYVFSRVSEGILKKKEEQSEDEAEKIILNKKIKEQQDFRVSLLGVKEEIAPTETPTVEPIVTTENKPIEPVVETNILTTEEQSVIDGFKDVEFKGSTKNWTDVIQSETSTPQEKKQALTELKEQLSDPNSEIATGEALGKSADLIYGLIDAEKTITPVIEKQDIVIDDNIVPDITVGEMVNQVGIYKGEKGSFFQDGQTVVFKVEGKPKEYELGNIDEIKDNPISNFGIEHEVSVVTTDDNGNIKVREDSYVNNFSDPFAAINRDANGNIVSVNLETPDGKKRTFRGNIAEDVAYQINLKEISKDNETRTEFENFINEDATQTEINNATVSAVPEETTTTDNAEISREKIEPIVQTENIVIPNDQTTNQQTDTENKQSNVQTDAAQPTKTIVTETTQPTKEATEKVKSFSTKARDLAAKIRKDGITPDFLKISDPNVNIKGIGDKQVSEALAKAIEFIADAVDAGIELSKAISDSFNEFKKVFTDNNEPFDEPTLKQGFTDYANDAFKEPNIKDLADQIRKDEIGYNDTIAGQPQSFIDELNKELGLSGKVNFDTERFKAQVRKQKSFGLTQEEVIAGFEAAKKLTKVQKGLIAEIFAETAETDKIAKELQEAFKQLAKGEKPKSVLKRLSVSNVTELVNALSDALTYTAVSNEQLGKMADFIVDSIDLNKADQYVNALVSNSVAGVRQVLRAKLIVALQKGGNKTIAAQLIKDMADEATQSGRQTQSLKMAYDILGAQGNPATRTEFARRTAEAIQKKASQMTSNYAKVISEQTAEIGKLNERIHQKAQASPFINKIKDVIANLCGLRNKKK